MRGFMCQSKGGAAVCMTGDSSHSVVVPRRAHNTRTLVGDSSRTRLITSSTSAKYSRLGDSKPNKFINDDHMGKNKPQSDQFQELKPDTKQELSRLQVSPLDNVFQVVVMRVALHCQACAGKVKKHLSKMEGVTSFSIDLETKMVRVMGNISPAAVLESVSKVKRAELWPS